MGLLLTPFRVGQVKKQLGTKICEKISLEASANTTVRMVFPVSVDHVVYMKGEATRYCQPNGTWESVGNYSSCRPFGVFV